MSGFFERFLPPGRDFFVLFERQAENIAAGAAAFSNMLEHYSGVPEQVQTRLLSTPRRNYPPDLSLTE